jgi:flavin reductase (DIM6/NTAB) family NADH-FMN oxidoreductase RutF
MRHMKLKRAFTLIEPGPVVLVTTCRAGTNNIMTISWTMVLDFTPVLAITTGPWNHSFAALQDTKECVIAIPTVDMLDTVVGFGTCSGADTDKFTKFKLTPVRASKVGAPLIRECLANIECKVVDFIDRHNIVVLEVVAAYRPQPQGKAHDARGGRRHVCGRRPQVKPPKDDGCQASRRYLKSTYQRSTCACLNRPR